MTPHSYSHSLEKTESRKRTFEAAALIISGTIGAGILGMPYVVAKVGVLIGFFWIAALGFLMMLLHLLLADVMLTIKEPMQLTGVAERYLGRGGKWAMSIIFYVMLTGVLVAYIIGEGQAFSALIGGSPFFWSCLFWFLASCLIAVGMKSVKATELILVAAILLVVVLVALASFPHLNGTFFTELHWSHFFLPYGIVLFSFHGTNTVSEVDGAVTKSPHELRKGIFMATTVIMLVYLIFSGVTVGVSGQETTDIATVGLGEKVGPIMVIFGNLFAALAMATSALIVGISLRDSLKWDFGIHRILATATIAIVPFTIFVLGLRRFITVINLVGGILVSMELLMILLIYRKARREIVRQGLDTWYHNGWIVGILFAVCGTGLVYSVANLL